MSLIADSPAAGAAPFTDVNDRLALVVRVAADAPARILVRGRLLAPGDARPANDFAQRGEAVERGQGDIVLPLLAEPWRTLLGPTATPPVLLDWLPAGLSYQAAVGIGWSCDALGQTVVCTVPPSIAGLRTPLVAVTVDVTASAPERLLNLSGLSAARTSPPPFLPLAAQCAPVQDSVIPEPRVPPLCRLAGTGP
jgi:hypothetical protein